MAYGVNAPFGFRPWGSLAGGPFTPKTNDYLIQASTDGVTTYASSLFTGDPVYFRRVLANGGGGTIGLIADSTVGGDGQPVGVFAGVKYTDTKGATQFSPYWPGATQVKSGTPIIASVWDDPMIIWDIQVSASSDILNDAVVLQSWFGQNSRHNFGHAGNNIPDNPLGGNTNNGFSCVYLDGASDGAAAAAQLKILKLTPIEGTNKPSPNLIINAIPYLNVLVVFNSHYYKSTGTAGVVPA